MGETDAQLIARTAHDPAAFAAVFDRRYPAIYRYAVARVGIAAHEATIEHVLEVARG